MKARLSVIVMMLAVVLAWSGSSSAQDAPEGDEPEAAEPEAAEPEAAEGKSESEGEASGPKPLSESLSGMAKAEYEAGKVLFADKDFKNAIVKFKKAHQESKDARLLWNIAVCQKNLRQYSKMIESVRRYRKEAAAVLGPDERSQADAIVKTVEGFISELKLTVDQKGVDVLVDGEKVATTPIAEKLFIDVGKRTITVRKSGYRDHQKTIEVTGGGVIEMKVRLEKDLHRGRLLVVAEEGNLIWVDGKAVAQTRWEGSLRSGAHSLKVTGEGMQPAQQDVTVEDNKTRRIDVELTPVPRDTTATILWIVGGVSLAAVTAVTSAFLFEPSSTPPVEGSINPGSVQLTIGSW